MAIQTERMRMRSSSNAAGARRPGLAATGPDIRPRGSSSWRGLARRRMLAGRAGRDKERPRVDGLRRA